MVRPRATEIFLHLQPGALAALLRELLPCEQPDGSLRGIPGLRAVVHRRHIELYLLDSIPKASLVLSAVSYRSWTEALDGIEPPQNPLRWLGNDPVALRPVELELEHSKPHAAAASAVLRRLRLFASPPEVTTSADHPGICALDWCDGPSTAQVALALLHQLGGIAATGTSGADTHLAVNAAGTRLLLRGPDLRTASAAERKLLMTADQHPFSADVLCSHIAERISGIGVHAYGADPTDSLVVGHERTTIVLTTRGGRLRWFQVNVEEVFPENFSVMSLDHDMLATLARRAGVSLPAFGFGPSFVASNLLDRASNYPPENRSLP